MQTHTTSTLKGAVDKDGKSIPVRTIKNHTLAGIHNECQELPAKYRGAHYKGSVVPCQTFGRPFMENLVNTEADLRAMFDSITLQDLEGPKPWHEYLPETDQDQVAKIQAALSMFREKAVAAGFKTDKTEKRSTVAKTWAAEKAKTDKATETVVKDRKTA